MAALPAAAQSAWTVSFEHAGIAEGARILINGAGGGVGGFAVQLAKRAGASTIATVDPRSAEAVGGQGAEQVIDCTATTRPRRLPSPSTRCPTLLPYR